MDNGACYGAGMRQTKARGRIQSKTIDIQCGTLLFLHIISWLYRFITTFLAVSYRHFALLEILSWRRPPPLFINTAMRDCVQKYMQLWAGTRTLFGIFKKCGTVYYGRKPNGEKGIPQTITTRWCWINRKNMVTRTSCYDKAGREVRRWQN